MIFDVHYIILGLIVLAMNIVPAFMPPTAIILSIFFVVYHLDFLSVIFLGVIMATIGRLILAALTESYIQPILPKKEKENMLNLNKIFDLNKYLSFLFIFIFTLSPLPTNQLFIAAGLAKAELSLVAVAFFIGQTINYAFWVNLSQNINNNIEGALISHFSKSEMYAVEFLGFAILYIITRINWGKVLRFLKKRISQDESDHSK